MDRHLNDEDLILHYYGEGRAEDRATNDAHLDTCAECQALWQEIASTLDLVDAARVPEPDETFEQTMWARVQSSLAQPPAGSLGQERRRHGSKVLRWALPALGLAAAVLIAVLTAHPWRASSPTVASGSAKSPAAAAAQTRIDPAGRERVLLTALNDHFQRSEMLLVELMNGGSGDELRFERQTADDLLDSSRVYRATAQQNGNVRLAEMLEDLESVLTEIARSPEKLDRGDMRSLRARINDDNLLFKVRAVSRQIQARQRSLSTE